MRYESYQAAGVAQGQQKSRYLDFETAKDAYFWEASISTPVPYVTFTVTARVHSHDYRDTCYLGLEGLTACES